MIRLVRMVREWFVWHRGPNAALRAAFKRHPIPSAWKRRSVVDLEQVDPTPVLCSASIVLALRRRGRVSA